MIRIVKEGKVSKNYIIGRCRWANVPRVVGMKELSLLTALRWRRTTIGRLFQCARTSYNNWLIWLYIDRRRRSLNGLNSRILNIQWTSSAAEDSCRWVFRECCIVVMNLQVKMYFILIFQDFKGTHRAIGNDREYETLSIGFATWTIATRPNLQ